MNKFNTQYTFNPDDHIGVYTDKPSVTVPDQSLTLRQLLVNYTRGGNLPQSNQAPAFFDETAFVPNLKKLDLTEIQELMEVNANNAVLIQEKYNILKNPIIINEDTKSSETPPVSS